MRDGFTRMSTKTTPTMKLACNFLKRTRARSSSPNSSSPKSRISSKPVSDGKQKCGSSVIFIWNLHYRPSRGKRLDAYRGTGSPLSRPAPWDRRRIRLRARRKTRPRDYRHIGSSPLHCSAPETRTIILIASGARPLHTKMRGRAFGRARAGVTARTGSHHCFGGVAGAGDVPGFAGTGGCFALALRRGLARARRMSSTCGARLAVSGRLARRLAMA